MILLSLVLSLHVAAPIDSVPLAGAHPAALGAAVRAGEPAHALVSPEIAGMRTVDLVRASETVEREIRRGGFPGAALAIGRRDQVVVERIPRGPKTRRSSSRYSGSPAARSAAAASTMKPISE